VSPMITRALPNGRSYLTNPKIHKSF
jgi:hypothetical protein